jgi:SNF2 family DNA or RNA helicase
MLFYSQIKREFSNASWQRGQVYFRSERVKDVRQEGDLVSAKVRGSEQSAYETTLTMARGTIFNSKCSCPAHRQYETHCKHVAALAIWIVERGSLLRAGVTGKLGLAPGNGPQMRGPNGQLPGQHPGQGGGRHGRDRHGRHRRNQMPPQIRGRPAKEVLANSTEGETEIFLSKAQRAAADRRLRKLLQSYPFLALSSFVIRRDKLAGLILGKDPQGSPLSIPITLAEANAILEYSIVPEKRDEPVLAQNAIPGDPVLYIKGLFQSVTASGIKSFSALIVEPAIRYRDPGNHTIQVSTLNYLHAQREQGFYKTEQGVLIFVPPNTAVPDTDMSFIQRLNPNDKNNKVYYQGQAALENLGKLLTHKHRDMMVFDPNVDAKVETTPLRLSSVNIGKKQDKNRALSYTFTTRLGVKLESADLDAMDRIGRLSPSYVWFGDVIYPFETSLTRLYQYASRTGVAAPDGKKRALPDDDKADEPQAPVNAAGGGSLHDDEENPLHPLAAFRLSLEMGAEDFQVDEDWPEFHAWRKDFDRKKIPVLPKTDYGFDLREYQDNGLSWLWSLYHRGLAALLADEMGLGKTHQVLAFFSSLYRPQLTKSGTLKRPSVEPSLVVAPTSVISAWKQKLTRYDTGLRWMIFHGSDRKLPKSGVDLVLTTYGILHREEALREREWHTVVLDEAQAIKNASTISSRAARMLKSKFRIAMTGTPIENQSTDLWSLLEFLLPGYLGSLPRFKRLYGFGREVPPEIQARALKRLVSPFLLRRTKSQVLKELPEKTEEIVQCEMTEIQKKAYRATLNSADARKARESLEAGGKVDYANILALLTRLKQVCDHPKLPLLTGDKPSKKASQIDPAESGKWEAFDELLSEALDSNLKVVVFTQYLGVMDIIGHALEKRGVGYTELRGDTSDRSERLDKFMTDPECKVFVCSLLAGGLGIDLTSASVCIHYDRWWNPAKENQATDRLHRFGQTRGVQVFKLQIPGTVEDRIASIIDTKVELSGALIEQSSLGLKAFSRKELLALLSPEAEE